MAFGNAVFWFPAVWQLVAGVGIVLTVMGCVPLMFARQRDGFGYAP
jgi:hypothetical protein